MSDFQELQNVINKEGFVFIGMVHPAVYGPLRGLNFILKNPDAKELDLYLKSGCGDIATHVWSKTMMAVRPMLIPKDLIPQSETKVVEVRTIKDGEAHIRKILAQHPFEKDQFYFRKGII